MTRRRRSLGYAIGEARRIRRNLLRMPQWKILDLAGACGLASVLLSMAINDVSILRFANLSRGGGHVWTVVGTTIIDITASQFNPSKISANDEDRVHGVLITETPRSFHQDPSEVGMDVYLSIINGGWYTRKDHPRWGRISEYWL